MAKKEILTDIKVQVYKILVVPVLTYGSKIWIPPKYQRKKIKSTYLRKIKGKTIRYKITNLIYSKNMKVKPITIRREACEMVWTRKPNK